MLWGRDTILITYPHFIERFITTTMTGTIDEDILLHQLSIILVRRKHIGRNAGFTALGGQCADDIIRLEAIYLKHRYSHGGKNLFDDGHRGANILRCFFTLRLISRECLGTEGGSMRVESYPQMRRLLLFKYFMKGVTESHDGRCVQSFGIDARILHECVIGAVNKCVSV